MKKLFTFLLIALTLALAACGSNFEWFPDPADTTVPVVSASVNGKALFLNSSTTTVGTLPANVVFSASEPTTVYFTIDGTEPSIASSFVEIPSAYDRITGPLIEASNTVLKFFGVDKSFEKNRSAIQTAVITASGSGVDITAPTVTAKIGSVTVTDNVDTQVSGLPITVSFTADEPAFIYYTVDGSSPSTTSPTFVDITTAGSYVNGPTITATNTTLKYIGVDKSENKLSSSTVTTIVKLGTDTTAPTVGATVFGQGSSVGQSLLNGGIVSVNRPATVNFIASEPVTIYYTTNGSEPTTLTPTTVSINSSLQASGPTLNDSGNTTLWFFGVDAANNQSSKISGTITLN